MKSAISIKFKTVKKIVKKFFQKKKFLPKLALFLTLPLVKTQLSVYQKMFFSNRNPFDSSLTVKNWNPKKWLTLVYIVHTYTVHTVQ